MAAPYEIYIGLRYLRAKRRQRTISLNTFVSVAGITLGVAALIGTLGIMTGFKEDLQAKILGTTSHIVVQDRTKDGMASYDTLVGQVEGVPHVVAATPFVLRQVLLTSQSGVQGIVLRGIEPAKEVRVTDLGKNIKAGRLSDLTTSVQASATDKPVADTTTNPDPKAPAPSEHPGIVLGKELSLRLGAFVGDNVNVVSPVGPVSAIGMVPKIRVFTVVAVFESGMFEYDSSLAY
ncbi:MAG: ABC transporter permease, partial [Nitrospirales bacterium]